MATVFCMTDSLGPFRLPSQRRTTLAAILAAGAVGLAACGTVTGAESETATSAAGGNHSQSDSVRAAALGETGVVSLGEADTARKTARPDSPAQLMVESVRVGSHDGFDRVVFDLVGDGEPGWFIDYTPTPAQQGSGAAIPFDGGTALNVNIDGTAYPFELNRADPQIGTIPGTGSITEVISAGTFEGHSQFVVGIKEQRPYSVEVLQEPHRLVIDVLHS